MNIPLLVVGMNGCICTYVCISMNTVCPPSSVNPGFKPLLADLYENDPVMFAKFSSTPDIETGWYELVVNLTLSLSSSPYLAEGTPCVELAWAKVPHDWACQPLHQFQKNRLVSFSTQVGGTRSGK